MIIHDNILHISLSFEIKLSQQAYWFGRAEREDSLAAVHTDSSYQHSWDLIAAHFFLFCFYTLKFDCGQKLTDALVFKLQCEHLTNTNDCISHFNSQMESNVLLRIVFLFSLETFNF